MCSSGNELLDPLRMVDTEWWCPEEKLDRLAMLYVPSKGQSVPFEDLANGALHSPRILGGGGGLLSAAADYQRFMAMLLRGGELDGVRLLSSRTIDLMTRNLLADGADLEALATDTYAETIFSGVGFGLGMAVVIDQAKNKSLFSEGSYFWGRRRVDRLLDRPR